MTQQPIPWFDQPLDTRERKILTYDRHGIPGLRMIGCHNTSHATAPLPPHYHRDCFEFTYVVQGNLTFHVDHRRYELSGGDLFLTFPDEIHDTGNAPCPCTGCTGFSWMSDARRGCWAWMENLPGS